MTTAKQLLGFFAWTASLWSALASPGFIDLSTGANRALDGPFSAAASNFLALNNTQMAFSYQSTGPCGLSGPHFHTNADEVVYSINSTGIASISLLNGTVITTRYGPGDMFVNPRGHLHWNMENVNSTGIVVSWFNNQQNNLMFLSSVLTNFVGIQLQQAFNISQSVAGSAFGDLPQPPDFINPCETNGGDLDFESFGLVDGVSAGLVFPMGPSNPAQLDGLVVESSGVVKSAPAVGDMFSYSANRPVELSGGVGGDVGSTFPLLNGISMSFEWMGLEPCGVETIHEHSNADQFLFVISGSGIAGWINTSGGINFFRFQKNDFFVLPRGMFHFVYNDDASANATIVSSFNNQHFNYAEIINRNGNGINYNAIPSAVLASAFGISVETAEAAFKLSPAPNSQNMREAVSSTSSNDGLCPDLNAAQVLQGRPSLQLNGTESGFLVSIPENLPADSCFGYGICAVGAAGTYI